MRRIPVAMTIAGSDSGGGAGIEADLKTFSAMGVHGTVALTAITAQNTVGVFAVQDVELSIVEKQIDVVLEDIGVDAAKTGMLHRSEVLMLVARKVREYGCTLVVNWAPGRLSLKEAIWRKTAGLLTWFTPAVNSMSFTVLE
ncbi:MAG: bifunctional hydroxymethylpyrimidine kinase/phosphomethylpyrimidine kinase [Thermoproteota archaeon]